MNRISAVLLVYFATASQGFAQITRDQAPVNQFKNPILQQQQRIIYQRQELEQQRSAYQQQAPLFSAEPSGKPLPAQVVSDAASATLNPALEIFSLGAGIGYSGLLSGDYNNDGVIELVFGNPGSIAFGQAVNGKFKLQTQLSLSDGINSLEYFRDLSSDGHYAFFMQNQTLQKLDLITRRVVATLDVGLTSSFKLQKSTKDTPAVILLRGHNNQLNVVDPISMKVVRSQSGFFAEIAALGSFTQKNKQQILLSDGQIYNYNGNNDLTYEKNISFNGNFKHHAVDVNQDGLDELLISEGWNSITLTSPLTAEVLWSKSTSQDIGALVVADVDQDGKPDGLYGDGQWGSIHAFNLLTGDTFWKISNPDHGVTNIVIADLDNDGKQDIGWGAGYSSSGADYFYIHDFTTKALKWRSEDIQFPVNAIAMADIDQDGDLDALAVSNKSDSGYGGGIIQAFDIQSQSRLLSTTAANNWGNSMNVIAHDLDKNGTTELIIGSSEIYDGLVRVLNGANGQEVYKKMLGSGDNVTTLAVADLDNDGFSEIIVGNGAEHTGSAGVFFTVLEGRTGMVKKKSPGLNFSWQGLLDLTTVDVNGSVMVYGLFNRNLYQYNYSQNTVKQLTNTGNYLQLAKIVVAGVPQLAITNDDGKLLRVSINGDELDRVTICANDSPTGLSSSGPDRVLFNCHSSFGEYNWFTDNISFTHQTQFHLAGDPQWVRHKDQDYYMVGGATVAVYNAQAQPQLPKADPIKLTTHVLKAITGTMTIAAEVDYFVLANSTSAGQFSFTDRKTGKFIYQPAGKLATETLKFYAVKGQAISPEAELTIEVTNAKPVAEHLNISTHWNKATQLTLIAKDDDQEALQFNLASDPQHGQLKLQDQAKGIVEYIPSGNSLEPVSFGFTAKDTLQSSDQKNVVITLTNTTPIAETKSYKTSYLTPVNGALQGQDADNDTLSYAISSQPTSGSLTLNSDNGLFVYTPSGDADQSISFSYVVKDKFATSTAQTVNISVQGAPKESSGGSSGGVLSWWASLALLLVAIRRRDVK